MSYAAQQANLPQLTGLPFAPVRDRLVTAGFTQSKFLGRPIRGISDNDIAIFFAGETSLWIRVSPASDDGVITEAGTWDTSDSGFQKIITAATPFIFAAVGAGAYYAATQVGNKVVEGDALTLTDYLKAGKAAYGLSDDFDVDAGAADEFESFDAVTDIGDVDMDFSEFDLIEASENSAADFDWGSVSDVAVPEASTGGFWDSLFSGNATEAIKDAVGVANQINTLYKSTKGPNVSVSTPSQTANANGTVTIRDASGARIVPMNPGQDYVTTSGSLVRNNGNGTYTVISPDGSTTTRSYSAAGISQMQPWMWLAIGGGALWLLTKK